MLSLIKKDLRLIFNLGNLSTLLVLLIVILITARTDQNDYLLISVATIMGSIMIILPFTYDDRYNYYVTMGSLPTNKKEIVLAKYLGFIFITILMMSLVVLIVQIFYMIGDTLQLDLSTILLIIFMQLIFTASVLFPIYLRFSYRVAKFAFVLVYVLIFTSNFIVSNGNISPNQYNSLLNMGALPVILVGSCMFIISFGISLYTYSKRTL